MLALSHLRSVVRSMSDHQQRQRHTRRSVAKPDQQASRATSHHSSAAPGELRCGWLLWGFDDGENDPRGVLGDFTSGFSLDAADYDMAGPSIGLCCGCANDSDHYRDSLTKAKTTWFPAPDRAHALAS